MKHLIYLAGLCLLLLFAFNVAALGQEKQWYQTNGPTGGSVHSLAMDSSGNLFAGIWNGGMFRSSDNGLTWNFSWKGVKRSTINSIQISRDGLLYAASFSFGFFRSTDSGRSWNSNNTGLEDTVIRCMTLSPKGNIFVGTNFKGIFRSTNNGINWSLVNNNLPQNSIFAIHATRKNLIFAGLLNGGIFRSSDDGETWIEVNQGITDKQIIALTSTEKKIFAGTSGGKVYRSTNDGNTWSEITVSPSGISSVFSMASNKASVVVVGTWTTGNFRSDDDGNSWSSLKDGFLDGSKAFLFDKGDNLFAGLNRGVYYYPRNGEQRTKLTNGLIASEVHSVTINSLGHIFAGVEADGLHRSTDNGKTWDKCISTNFTIESIVIHPIGYIFASSPFHGALWRSKDNGKSWESLSSKLDPSMFIVELKTNTNGHIFGIGQRDVEIGRKEGCLVFSTDFGDSWNYSKTGFNNLYLKTIAIAPSGEIFVGTYGGGIYSTIDNGTTWRQAGFENNYINEIAINSKGHIFVRAMTTLYRSLGKNQPWEMVYIRPTITSAAAITFNSHDHIFAASDIPAVFSSDNGTTWKDISDGLFAYPSSFAFSQDGRVIAGTDGAGVYWYGDSPVVSVSKEEKSNFLTILLHQNYPNPFNSSTNITFSLSAPNFTTLRIFNILGQPIATLFSQYLSPGSYSIKWDAMNIPSGIYFYQLYSVNFTQSKKLLLTK